MIYLEEMHFDEKHTLAGALSGIIQYIRIQSNIIILQSVKCVLTSGVTLWQQLSLNLVTGRNKQTTYLYFLLFSFLLLA